MATDVEMTGVEPITGARELPPPSIVEQWTSEQLLGFAPIQEILWKEKNRATVSDAEIDGKAFLECGDDRHFWTDECHLPLGPSVKLAKLVQRIKDPTIEAKEKERIAEEAKRIAEEKERIAEEAKRIAIEAARDEFIKKLHSKIQRVSCKVSEYCDPNHKQLLPFPFPHRVPARFKLDKHGYFEFYGRSKFRELYEVAHSMDCRVNPQYFFHGTLGAGKSHLLAALTCLLMREGKIVVYIPDCSELLGNPKEYFLAALEITYGSREHVPSLLKALRREVVEEHIALERLLDFCNKRLDSAFFIVDQANAFDDDSVPGSHRFSNEKKKQIRNFLDTSSAIHVKLESSTANYKHAWTNSRRRTSEKRIDLYCGLDKEEMETWWAANGKTLTDQLPPRFPFVQEEKEYLEELTGKMPILLNQLAGVKVKHPSEDDDIAMNVDASSNNSDFPARLTLFHDAFFKSNEVHTFIRDITQFWTDHEESLNEDLKYKHRDVVLACLTCDTVDISALRLLDWRYFYVDKDEYGHTTCGVVRLAAGTLLRRVKNINDFRDPGWVTKMEMSGRNPVVLGFHVEHLTLLQIFLRGCLVAGNEFGETRSVEVFDKTMPPPLKRDFEGTILFRPASSNFRAVDGILAYREKENKKAVVVGIQITIARSHSDSEMNFISCWNHWKAYMQCENIEFRFLWILENRGNRKEKIVVPLKTRKLKDRTIVVTPQYTSIETTVKEVDKAIGRSLERARESAW